MRSCMFNLENELYIVCICHEGWFFLECGLELVHGENMTNFPLPLLYLDV